MRSKPLLYTPDWLVSFQKEIAGALFLTPDTGEVICEYRKRYGMSQEEFGELMELRRESISRIENGSVTPTFDFAKKFVNAMALIEAIRVERAQHKEIDIYFLENLAKELGFDREKLEFMLKVAVESYDKKLVKIQKSLRR
ncbi:MAG: helix-turn-helix domain-containing protein [Candidatus Methanoperedens sp.]|uniref:helix-turn-helix domain-containing protein n=1 Tax=Candidatus Methanoperedens sp. BLZ2 TaxID=2035255 RepID=UPI0011421AA1|nr:helix-turn-helix domain-containing protein [Candidatus Methanoperedens sp. BLZ2]KAB2948262.1 MAG: helix-turn-helix transcriptional regulator [Candidatus Methanoperedens sp.]MBZ0174810.1 helix-turn-helix domain-containing protein [Candidatus Methanoperedens nitroreducens]MCX9076963.1 helix-turn-helix domain-containing protein [Candidatus Methanoperedens sp.]